MNSTAPNPPEAKPAQPAHGQDGNGHDGNGHDTKGPDNHGHDGKAAVGDHDLPTDLPRPSGFFVAMLGVAAVLLLVAMFLIGYIPHHQGQTQIDQDAEATAGQVPIVQVGLPKQAKSESNIFLPANVQAWQQTALYPRALGYLAKWTYDIGSRVKKNDVLAVISAPDVDAQLSQAIANLAQGRAAVEKAQADVTIAKNTYQRVLQWMNTTAGVSQQDLEDKKSQYDDAVAIEHQSEANVKALQAAVQQLQVSQGFEQIVAPFTGIVTARNYDVGALMSPSNTSAKEMFDMAETDWLRVFISVPQNYADSVVVGKSEAFLAVRSYAGREFQGWVTRSAGAVDPNSRTMTVEVDIPNPDGLLNPGMYGTMRLPIGNPHPALIVPTSALVFDAAGLRVAVVKDNTAHFVDIKAGRDYGTSIEVTDGITPTDQVIDNPGEQVADGTKVQIQRPSQPAQAPNQKVAQAN
jgi:membrane fusion protein (multidrug efflux system)